VVVPSQRVQSVFLKAVEVTDVAGRAAVLDRECEGQPELRGRVEALLRAHDEPGSFLEQPAVAGAAGNGGPQEPRTLPAGSPPADVSATPEGPGTRIGPYKLLQRIGDGGMGTVWMAEQQEPIRRMVALKVIKAGMDGAQVVARFEAERQALALMDHPNIARVFDGGKTEGGRPYFVMELVKGTPLNKYCDEHRLTIPRRLELFVTVCQALQHAHQKGIIHRDIKPSNVLVAPYDGVPVVKVIDFGVAKATGQRLTERTMFTEFGAVVGTLQYMSPEQAELNNQDIDTRSDVYSLGVLLYELLTGTTPLEASRLQGAAFAALLMAIVEEEAPKPSTRLSQSKESLPTISAQRQTDPTKLAKLLRGELDCIVLKALAKERSRRYETANALARDIQRYLADEPVEAQPPSARYRLAKFARKNRTVLVALALVWLAMGLGLLGSAWGLWGQMQAKAAVQAEAEQRQLADREREEKEQARGAAEASRVAAESASDRAERARYFNCFSAASMYWSVNNLTVSRRMLEACPVGLRGWEWHYLDRAHHPEMLSLPGNGQFTRSLHFSGDGKRMTAFSPWGAAGARIWDLTTNRPLAEILSSQCPAPLTSVALSRDGQTLAAANQTGAVGLWDAGTGRFVRELARLPRPATSLSFSPDGRWLAAASANSRNGENLLPWADAQRQEDLVVWDVAGGKEVFHPKGCGFVALFSPDGSRLLTYRMNTAFRPTAFTPEFYASLIETGRWAPVADIKPGQPQSVSFSGDGKRLALGILDRARGGSVVHVLDAATGNEQFSLPGRANGDIDLSPDGTFLARVSDSTAENLGSFDRSQIQIWDLKHRRLTATLRGHTQQINAVVFSPDGRLASCAWDNTVKFWDPASTGGLTRLAPAKLAYLIPAALSPGGKLLAFGQNNSAILFVGAYRSVTLTDTDTGRVRHTLNGRPEALEFSRDGTRLAVGAESGETKVWDPVSGAAVCTHRGPDGLVAALALSADGSLAATAHEPKEFTAIRRGQAPLGKPIPVAVQVWDAKTGRDLRTLSGHASGVYRIAFSPDGQILATAGYQSVKLWEPTTGRLVRELDVKAMASNAGDALLFSPAGDLLATVGGLVVQVWDVASGRSAGVFAGHSQGLFGGVAFSPDQTRLATSYGAEVKVWDIGSGQEALALPLPAPGPEERPPQVAALAWSTDGQRLRAALRDGSAVEWDGRPRPAK
jgi:serine/threonine protein kinase/WD40 repeat protein